MFHINRCLISAGTLYFSSNVNALLSVIPISSYEIITGEYKEKWIINERKLFFRRNQLGRILGTEKDPIMKINGEYGLSSTPGFAVKRFKDGTIDWDDQNIYSPYLTEEQESIDYDMLLRLIMYEFQFDGLTYKTNRKSEAR